MISLGRRTPAAPPSRKPWLLVATALLVASCGGDDTASPVDDGASPGPSTTAPSATTTIEPTDGTTSTTRPPTSSTPPPTRPALPIDGPAWLLDFPDPFVLATADGSYAYGTASGLVSVQRLDAPDLTEWRGPTDAMPDHPAWAVPLSNWAPSVLAVDGRFVLYHAALVAGTDQHCIGVATADTPSGPFVDVGDAPLICPLELGGAIDPSPFVDTDGTIHLLWKNDGVTLRRESSIWSQPLDDSGTKVDGPAVELIATDQRWEYPHVEAPSMALVDGTYWLAYSGNWWNQEAYGVGVARCTSPNSPCTKPLDGPVLRSTPGAEGPGGAEFFRDGTDRLLVAYHAWDDDVGYPGARALWISEVRVVDGVPELSST